MKLDRLSREYIGCFARAVAQGPPKIAFALYDEPSQWRKMVQALEGELRFFQVGITHLDCGSSDGGHLVEKWLEALGGAGPHDRLFVVDEVSVLRDDKFTLLFRALEECRELLLDANRGTFLLSVTPERVAEIAWHAPGFYSIADVVLLSEEKFRLPDDPAYLEDRAEMEAELRELERRYSFPSEQLWERMASGSCTEVPNEDLRRWERLVEALRKE